MIGKKIEDISQEDIENLVSDAVPESKTLEYKEKLLGGSDGERKEFLADISSVANASGGDIIYGIAEQRDANGKPTGIPEKVVGLPGINVGAEVLRLEAMIRDGIDPRIPGVQHAVIEGFDGGPVLLVRVPKSWASPHMITYKSESRFYSRTSQGKYSLDVQEIRSAFLVSDSYSQRITRWRDDRIGKILSGETPVPLLPHGKIVLHIVPISSLDGGTPLDVQGLQSELRQAQPLYGGGGYTRYNLDGFLNYSPSKDGEPRINYIQFFRDGRIETVDTSMLRGRDVRQKTIPSITIEQTIVADLKVYLDLLCRVGIPLPYIVSLSLVDVLGYEMSTSANLRDYLDEPHRIDRNVVVLPDLSIVEPDWNLPLLLKPVFDALWQATGFSRSHNYDRETGKWICGR